MILVTGATGQLGTAVIQTLLKDAPQAVHKRRVPAVILERTSL